MSTVLNYPHHFPSFFSFEAQWCLLFSFGHRISGDLLTHLHDHPASFLGFYTYCGGLLSRSPVNSENEGAQYIHVHNDTCIPGLFNEFLFIINTQTKIQAL